MRKRVLDHDPLSGVTTYHAYDHSTKTTWIETVQETDSILEANKALQNMGNGGAGGLNPYSQVGIKQEWWHVASIPVGLIHKWKVEEGIDVFNKDHWRAVARKLQDPDYRSLRTGTGRL